LTRRNIISDEQSQAAQHVQPGCFLNLSFFLALAAILIFNPIPMLGASPMLGTSPDPVPFFGRGGKESISLPWDDRFDLKNTLKSGIQTCAFCAIITLQELYRVIFRSWNIAYFCP
jgi:hypothetical protein